MSLVYNFTFAELAIKFLETANVEYLNKISELDATNHIFNHALRFNTGVPTKSKPQLVTHLLTPIQKHKKSLPHIIRNLEYAKEHIANHYIVEKTALEFLPEGFSFSGSLFFTVGYDIGVAFGDNCSLNLAHPIFLQRDMSEMKYYAIHELHHAGFIALKGFMPSLEISSRKEMACVIEYLTHLEGMGTYAALNIRLQEGAMNTDNDYISFQDQQLLDCLIKEYFDIYHYFKDNPDETLHEEDWQKIAILSDVKRLLYVVGAHIARTIEYRKGKAYLVNLISQPSENFIKAFM
ncbi:MAG: hypothetical protein FWC77_06715 [Defluviitaleaceae bacterium]|nr:hypothetical protein [Defluviitaleaceae bacterium]